ncbi:MAG TPA: hypothetical protein VN969_23600 [Streptosporangiaceae bacterium]|jgi:hypothetical protein|nr:hypothetical protein [Streptosporangiaceae bacterium]
MNSVASRPRDSSYPASLTSRTIRLLGPGTAQTSPVVRWAASLLTVAGAALLIWSSVIHLQLWSDGYRSISVIGPLFLIQGVGGIALAVVMAAFRRLVLMVAGAFMLAGTAVGLLLSASIGLFGFQESLAVPNAKASLVVEFAGAAVLAAAAALVVAGWLARRRSAGQSS